jgi:multisubunit Na+/H+ antiporter MnhG subunit
METNIYKPPESNVAQAELMSPEFYVVSRNKFLILFISTLGIYRLYWFYKNWSLYRKSSGKKILPILRAFFSIFFAHSLFKLFDGKSKEIDNTYKWSPGNMATLYVLFAILENVSDRLSRKSIGEPFTDFILLITLPVIGWTLYKAQISANIACDDPAGAGNSRLTPANYAWIVLGAVFWVIVGLGLYTVTVGPPEWN